MPPLAASAAGLDLFALPAWVLDPDTIRIVWANAPAAELWGAPDRADLLTRDFSDISAPMRARVARQASEARAGRTVVEQTTFYPRGLPVTVRTHVSGIGLPDTRIGLLVQVIASDHEAQDPDLLRGIEALRHSETLVTLLDLGGAILMQNPATLLAFGDAPWEAWFSDCAAAAALLRDIDRTGRAQAELFARTASGERLHRVTAHRVRDPVTGGPAFLVQQTDETARFRAEQAAAEEALVIARQQQEILALSAPIIEIGERALAVPLVGALDEARAAQIMSRLLAAVADRRAASIIIDLTGVERLDEASAARLTTIARAVRLLGAAVILCGIRPEAARLMVETGEELGGVTVRRTLRDALERARG